MKKIMFLDDELKKAIEIERYYRKEQIKLQEEINNYLKEYDEELKKINTNKQLADTITLWSNVLNKSGFEISKIEINGKIYRRPKQ